jgi:hypothetical protein
MSDILTGIGGLKKISSLLRARKSSPPSAIEKGGDVSDLKKIGVTPQRSTTATGIRLNHDILISGDRDKEIRNLIQKRLLYEKAVRLKQEIKNLSSIFVSILG